MKTILVPTDFSEIAQNAIDYAVEIAKITKAKLVLFNVYNVPVVPAEIPIALPVDEMKKEVMKNLRKIETDIHRKHGDKVAVECESAFGFPVEEINLFAEENKADLIIMGMEGAGYLTEKLIGSTTTSLIQKAKCPVLAIDKHIKFKNIKQIALACDYKQIQDKSVLEPLKALARLFKSQVYVLNVVREPETIPTVAEAIAGVKLDHSLEDINHTFHYIENENVVDGINQFVDEHAIDMIVMIPRTHTALKNLFQKSHTKRMAFHTKAALLALHE